MSRHDGPENFRGGPEQFPGQGPNSAAFAEAYGMQGQFSNPSAGAINENAAFNQGYLNMPPMSGYENAYTSGYGGGYENTGSQNGGPGQSQEFGPQGEGQGLLQGHGRKGHHGHGHRFNPQDVNGEDPTQPGTTPENGVIGPNGQPGFGRKGHHGHHGHHGVLQALDTLTGDNALTSDEQSQIGQIVQSTQTSDQTTFTSLQTDQKQLVTDETAGTIDTGTVTTDQQNLQKDQQALAQNQQNETLQILQALTPAQRQALAQSGALSPQLETATTTTPATTTTAAATTTTA